MRRWILCVACALLAACGDGGSGGTSSSARLTLAQLNTLNGISGDGCHATDKCRLADRIDLLFQWIAHSGCPDLVTLQEVGSETASLITDHLAGTCPFAYTAVMGQQVLGVDDETVLTRYPVLASDETERIDYIFLVPPRTDFPCRARLDRADREGVGTQLFADRPNPFAQTCGPLPAAICWPSDHIGVQLDLNCG